MRYVTAIAMLLVGLAPLDAIPYLQAGLDGTAGDFLEATSTRATIAIDGRIAVTHLDQVFTNRSDRQVEGLCAFSLPENAFVSDLAVWEGDSRRLGTIAGVAEVRTAYQTRVYGAGGGAPTPLAGTGPAGYRLGVYPVPPQGRLRLEIEYTEWLGWSDGALRYRLPLAAAGAPTLRELGVSATVRRQRPTAIAVTPTYQPMAVVQTDPDDTVRLLYADEELSAREDLELALADDGATTPTAEVLSAGPTPTNAGYYAVWIPPLAALGASGTWPRGVTYAVDVSASMGGARLAAVRQAVAEALARLGPSDRFGLVAFGIQATAMSPTPVPATPENQEAALAFLDARTPQGGASYEAGLREAARLSFPDGWTNHVVLLTDGAPTVGVADAEGLAEAARGATTGSLVVNAVGIGDVVDGELLRRLCALLDGTAMLVDHEGDLAARLSDLLATVGWPAFLPARVELVGAAPFDALSPTPRALLPGQELMQVGRYWSGGSAAFEVEGNWFGEPVAVSYPVSLAAADASPGPADSVLFFDDFVDDRGGWRQGPGPFELEGVWEVDADSGVYRIRVDGGSWAYVRVSATTYAIETRVRPGSWEAKVVYGGADGSEGYRVDLLPSQSLGGVSTLRVLAPEQPMSVAYVECGPGPWYVLRVEYAGDTVTTYVDGVKVHDRLAVAVPVTDGCIGIGSYGPTHETDFDYVRVTTLGGAAAPTSALLTPVARLWAWLQAASLEPQTGSETAPAAYELEALGYRHRLVTSRTALFVSGHDVAACLDVLGQGATAVVDEAEGSAGVAGPPPSLVPVLAPNYPNPFNAATTIRCWFPAGAAAGTARLRIHDLAGQRVRSWTMAQPPAGERTVRWDGRDEAGNDLASGVYLIRLETASGVACRRALLVR